MSKKHDKKEKEDEKDWEDAEMEEEQEKKPKNKNKVVQNYLAAIILLLGLLAGSIFVDVAQLIKGEGISLKRLEGQDLFTYGGKTWVAYNSPAVNLTVVNDENCDTCKADSAILGLKTAIPTVVPREVSVNSDEGKALLQKTGAKMIPVFIFDKSIEKSEVFDKIQNVLTQKDDIYVLDTSVLGIQGKYNDLPPFASKNQEVLGNPDAKVSIIEFSDFQCPYCKMLADAISQLMNTGDYKNKVKVSFKTLPLSFHAQSNDAAMAAECAGEQGKFWPMHDMLFAKQADWGNANDITKFKSYAVQLKLDTAKFNQCLDSKKYQADIDADANLAKDYNISGTPALFVNDQFNSGAVQFDALKQQVDALLAK